jgi:gliding motility-associated-like protein
MRKLYQNLQLFFCAACKIIAISVFILLCNSTFAQCPPNIDFEQGDFTGWQCYSGSFNGVINVAPTLPITNRHDMFSTRPPRNNLVDIYGGFLKNCPNGSRNSVKIGNETTGQTADKISYTFTIPAGQNTFNLIYNYAIVLNDANNSNHPANLQPRLIIDVKNVTDGTPLLCPLDPIVVNGNLPGFYDSPVPAPNGSLVRCKNWAAASIKLDDNAGKTIEVSFTVTGCGLSGGSHFGYAYIDVNTQCGSSFVGATFCSDDTLVNVSAPSGYQSYKWFNNNFSQVLGTQQTLVLNPPPLSGDSVFVEMTPYNGYGCLDTLTANLWDTLTVSADAGPDKKTCDNNPVQLGVPPVPGLVYKWSPATGLSDTSIANPIAAPSVTTQYTLTVKNNGGGCATPDVVKVTVDLLSDSIELIGVPSYCTGSGQSVLLKVFAADSIQWYKDNVAIPGTNQTQLNITQTGVYYARLFSSAGCSRTTAVKQINIYESPVADFSINNISQCFTDNQFVFTNRSTLLTGGLQYAWFLGDNTTAVTRNVVHNYAADGNYTVKLLVTAPGGCKDSSTYNVVVKPGPVANFTVDKPADCFKNNSFVFTNSSTVSSGTLIYNWDLGDATFPATKDVTHSYSQPGTYLVKLTTTAAGGVCQDDSSFTVFVHPSPKAGFTINNDIQCFPGHQFVFNNSSTILNGALQYNWVMGDGTINSIMDTLKYSYAKAGNYTVKLLVTALGSCKDSLSLDIVVHPTPSANFTVQPVCENLRLPVVNKTLNNTTSVIKYIWDFGNGYTDNNQNPVYNYPVAGTYDIKLSVSTAQCPVSIDTKTVKVTIDAQAKGIIYPDKDAAFNFPEPLQARTIGNSAAWSPPTSLSNRFSYTPTFTGILPQLYTVVLKTATGCITVDTQFVKTHKAIEVYVPTSFTPDGNGLNERLRPVLIGFSKVNYFRIFNRWGKLLFTMNSDQPGWDGNVGGRPAEMQALVWMIEAVDVDGKVHNKQGTTVLYR